MRTDCLLIREQSELFPIQLPGRVGGFDVACIQPYSIPGSEQRGGPFGLVVTLGVPVLDGGYLSFNQLVDFLQVLGGILGTGFLGAGALP